MRNTEYWNKEGAKKKFSHPFCSQWLNLFDPKSPVLDLGCGYGRLTPELLAQGYSNLVGYDASPVMIERARHENPGADYLCDLSLLSKKSFDLILCFALFTSCPSKLGQQELAALINSVSHKGTIVYISDYETCDNPDYQNRYNERQLDMYGCFTSGSGIFRHHEPEHFSCLLPGWEMQKEKALSSTTLNGNKITIHQYLYIKQP